MQTYNIAVLPGDGIGPEVVDAAVRVLEHTAARHGFSVNVAEHLFGGAAIDAIGDPFPAETRAACLASDAVLLGAVGGAKWDGGAVRPEQGLLRLRKELGLFANIRPIRLFPALRDRCALKRDDWDDFLIVRELTGGVYFGERVEATGTTNRFARDETLYTEAEITRVVALAFDLAVKRRKHVTMVDKANVLATSRLWRTIFLEHARKSPGIAADVMLVDNAAMQIILNPGQFDVMVTENMFGDILSDEAGAAAGSVGLAPSSSLGAAGKPGVFEAIHGSAPDIAGKNIANPIGSILSVAMMLDRLGELAAARAIERAVDAVLTAGHRTADIADHAAIGTQEMGLHVIHAF